ncbi:MAG: site-specific integrase [Acidobacteriaceae bacterium]
MKRSKRSTPRSKLINPDHLNKFVGGISDRRAKALALLMLDTGLRAGEVASLDKKSIKFESRVLSDGSVRASVTGQVFCAKSQKERTFYLSARTVAALTDYLTNDRGDDESPALFVGKDGTRLSPAAVHRVMHRCCDLLGIERIGPHQLRNYFAFAFMKSGGAPGVLKHLLGHSSMQSTLRTYPPLDLQVN